MRSFLILALAMCLTASGAVAFAAVPADPHIVDECGDADTMARVGDAEQQAPDADRSAGFDIQTASFEDIVEDDETVGVQVSLELCGAVPDPELIGSHWSVRWGVDEECSAVVSIGDGIDLPEPSQGVLRGATLARQCGTTTSGPTGASSEGYTEWIEALDDDAYTIDESVIIWTLTPQTLPMERADRFGFLATGSSWTTPQADTRDGRWLSGGWFDEPVPFRLTGPGSRDTAEGGRDFTVGESVDR